MQQQTNYIKDYRKLAQLLKDGATFTAFDTETTGLHSQEDRIIEIGAVKFNADGIVSKFNTLINPDKYISPQVTQINHITNEMVKDCPFIKDIIYDFLDFIKNTYIVAHNAAFDIRFINAELNRLNLAELQNKVIDTLRFSRWVLPELKKYNQVFLAEKFNINVKNAHRACDDALVCGNLFLHLIKESAERQIISI